MNGRNITFPIYNEDGTSFNNLVMHKATIDKQVMSLGYKITGDVYYKNNKLHTTMNEYIEYEDVKYFLVNPPTIVREGLASENSENKGMTKYSFEFYHPMYMLGNIPMTDVATSSDETKYKSQDKVFSWVGKPDDYIRKINKNLEGTPFVVVKSDRFPQDIDDVISDVISFNNNYVSDALKIAYDTWGVPYVVDTLDEGEYYYQNGNFQTDYYSIGKRYVILWGVPSNEIYASENDKQINNPFVFMFGKGVGLKNNSRNPRDNKIITRISGYGSESNIPYGYPQIVWTGNQEWDYTINNDSTNPNSYPIYKGIVGGQYVKLIKHPFTRTHLMPTIYGETINKKVNPLASGYNPNIEIKDYYDAISDASYQYPNEINTQAPSYEIHEFDVKPELGSKSVTGAVPLDGNLQPTDHWDDSIDDDGNYVQSYFRISLPILDFDIYACASITQEMQINMRSGACIGCTFQIQVDWDDYKKNFYDSDGNFVPDGANRDYTKYPDSSTTPIDVIVAKDTNTFGIIMPNTYQRVLSGDEFVILGISLPLSYITNAETRLDNEMKSYMLENNVYYHEYPLKFDEYFLANNTYILNQIRPNCIVRFKYGDDNLELFVKQITIKYGESVLPQYDITLTDNIEVTLNQIGQVADDVERLSTLISALRENYSRNVWNELSKKLSKVQDDTSQGKITSLKGFQAGTDFVSGLLGEGGIFRKEADGTTYIETDRLYVRLKAYFDEIEVKKYTHSGGNRIASKTGIKTVKVEYYNANDEIVEDASQAAYYRCYFRLTDDEGNTITNDWVVGDLARSQEFKQGTNGYWRAVVGVGTTPDSDGLGYIDLSKTDCLSGSDVPQEQDDIIQLGNKTNADRQGAIIEYSSGANAPSYQIYQNINSYDLTGKNVIALGYDSSTDKAYMNVYGDAFIGNVNGSYLQYNSTTGALTIKAAIDAQSTMGGKPIGEQFEYLQEQIDGSVANWYVTETPTLLNYPASDWTSDEQRSLHVDELAYNKTNGNVYRFVYDEANDIYKWELVPAEDVPSSLRKFADLQYLADALGENTSIDGGLILTSLIQLRDTNGNVLSGISGLYDTTLDDPKKSIAAWYGGVKTDWETLSDAQKQSATDGSYAKSLFRMDGTGYVASGNISWDSLGRVTLKNLYTDTGKSIDQLLALFSIGGTIPTNAYITPAYPFSDLQVLTNSGNAVSVKDYLSLFIPHYNQTTGELESIESPVPLWSQGEVSALGYDGSGGGGGGGADLSAVWATLTGNTGTYKDYQINIGHLTSALSNYALSSNLATVATSGSYNDLSNKPTIPAAQIQSNWTQTNTSAKDYIKNKPTIPAAQIQSDWNQTSTSAKDYIKNKPTNVSAFNNDANYVTSSLLNTTLESYATTSAMNTELAKYLKLTGGTLSGNLTIERSGTVGGKVIATNSNGSVAIYTATQRGLWDETNSKWIVATNGTNTFMLSGNVGINTTSPSYQLHVNGYSYATRYYANGENYISGSTDQLYFSVGGVNPIVMTSSYVRRGTTEDAANVTLGTSSYRWANTYSVLGNFSGLLTASGNIKTASYIEIGDYRIVADTANTALKVVNKDGTTAVNFYATGENSALGVNTSGGGGGGDGASLEAVWTSLGSSTGTYGSSQINASHLTTALNGYATQTWVNQQGFLKSYTETDPVFTASAAHGITSSDITSWNNKVSNVQANWNATSGLAVILNKPTLATVATSGKYSDLTGKPTNVSSFTNDANYVTSSSLATTLASYATTSAMNTALSGYLPLTGGTLSGNLSVERTGTTTAKVTALNTNGSVSIYQGTGNNRGLYDDTNSKWIVGTNGTNSFLMEGNVGIGTTSPSYKLHVDGTAYASSAFDVATGTTTDTLGYKVGGGTVVRGTSTSVIISPPSSSGSINFYPKGSGDTTNRSIIDNNGNLGINTNTPSYQLHVNGDAYATKYYANSENYFSGSTDQLFFTVGGISPLVMTDTYVRRGVAADAANITLGTSSYRWANLYSVLGNFSGQITSSVETGTSPLNVASTTLNENLNADLLDGYHATDIPRLGWVSVNNATGSSDQCKWYEVNVPTSSGTLFVYEIISRRSVYPLVAYYRLAIYRYNANVVNVSLINEGFNYRSSNNTRVCVAIDSNQKVYIQSGSRTASNYLNIRSILNQGGVNTTAVGEAAFGTANGFTALKMITDSGYFRVDTSAATQSTTYDGDPMMITSLRIGDAYIWWDDTNSCLRVTGANTSGKPVASVAINLNVSGEVTALKTS